MPKTQTLDPTEAHIIANAQRFYVTTPRSALRPRFGHDNPDQRVVTCYHFTLQEACDYARWLQRVVPALACRILVYAAQCDHPDAPSAAQQWRSVLVPKEYWI